jgi:hypothetical protein
MPRFWRDLFGPRVMTSPQVMSGATSPGQQCCTGRRARSTSAPSHTTSWQGAELATLGVMCHSVLSRPPRPSMSLKPLGASGSLRLASSSPNVRSSRTSATPMARATRAVVPNKLPSTGIAVAGGLLEQQRRAIGAQGAVAQGGHLQNRRHGHGHAPQLTRGFQLGHEVTQVVVGHVQSPPVVSSPSQRGASVFGRSSRSKTRATVWSTISATDCGRW